MKEEKYQLLVSQISSLINGEKDTTAVMSMWQRLFIRQWDSGGLDFIESSATSWCLVHSKAPSLVCTSHTAKACVERLGKEQRRLLCQTLNSSLVI